MSGTGHDTVSGRRTARRGLAAALALLCAGCAAAPGAEPAAAPPAPASANAPGPPAATAPPAPAAAPAPAFPAAPSPEWIAARIAALEAARDKGRSADPDGAIALELALLYSHPDNPAPDHAKALAMMRDYLALSPPGSRNPLIHHVAGLLEDVEGLGRTISASRAREKELASEVQALERRVAEGEQRDAAAKKREQELLAQIKMLQQQIEQLQRLDLEMEKRRRSVR